VNLDRHPSYKALSYTWGSESSPKHTICLNGCRFEVRENLWHALNQFQSDNTELVMWIDAICINQSSDGERNHQVAKMKMVYEQAIEVIAWLGPSYEDSDLAIQLVHELYQHRKSTKWIKKRFSEPDIEMGLVKLWGVFLRDYWWRIWIVQELALARKIVFYCGQSSMEAKCLHAVQQLFDQMLEFDGVSKNLLIHVLHGNVDARASLLHNGLHDIYRWKRELVSTKPSFYASLLYHTKRQSSDARDMIYGLAALANQTSKYRVEVDYELSTKEVFTNFAKLEIETSKKLDIITRVLPGTTLHDLPSWVPDWSSPAQKSTHTFIYHVYQPQFRYSAGSRTEAAVAFGVGRLTFTGVKIGSIDLLGPQSGMENYWDASHGTLALFKLWELVTRMGRTSSSDLEAFVRVLIFDRIEKDNLGRRTKSEFLLGILGYLGLVFSDSKLIQPGRSNLLGYWRSYLTLDTKGRATMNASAVAAEAMSIMPTWMAIILQNIWDRRLFFSSPKAMGLALEGVMEGDIICIPLGCSHPVVLRKVEDCYINLGEAYVDGYMYGEAVQMVDRGELKLEEFELR
jgi:Heterokaryon incompatibility protein (HET)